MNKNESIVKQITDKISIIALIIGIILLIWFIGSFGNKNITLSKVKKGSEEKWDFYCEEYHQCMNEESNTEDFCRFMNYGCNYEEVKQYYDKKYGYVIFLLTGSIGSFVVSFIFHTKKQKTSENQQVKSDNDK